MANSIDITIDLPNEKFNVSDGAQLTGALSVTITAPDGTASAATAVADGGATDFLFSSVGGWTNASNNLQRGTWKFAYEDSAGTPVTGNVQFSFDNTNFPTNTIEDVDASGVAVTRDCVLSTSVDMSSDCFSSELTVTDNTTYLIGGVTPSWGTPYANTIYSPPNVAPATNVNTVAGTASIITPIYTGTYSSYISGTAIWLFDETNSLVTESNSHDTDVFVLSEIDGGSQLTINCLSSNICEVWECIRDINTKYTEALCVNKKLADKYKSKLERAMQLVTLAEKAIICGGSTLLDTYIDEIKTVTNCTTC